MSNFFTTFFTSLFSFLDQVFSGRTGDVLEKILEVGTPIVANLMNEDLPNNIKRETAINQIGIALTDLGITAAEHAISLGVELLVSKMKK